jgi:hypothetical protein
VSTNEEERKKREVGENVLLSDGLPASGGKGGLARIEYRKREVDALLVPSLSERRRSLDNNLVPSNAQQESSQRCSTS